MDYLYTALISIGSSAIVSTIVFLIYSHIKDNKRKMKRNINYEDIETYDDLSNLLGGMIDNIKSNQEKTDILKQTVVNLEQNNLLNLKKIGLVRYKYSDYAGGNLSFSLALMDDKQNGIVLTNIALQDSNSVYLRKITDGVSDILLMEEEREAIEKAE